VNKGDAMRRHKSSLIVGLGLILIAALPVAAGPLASRPYAPPLAVPAWSLLGDCYPIVGTKGIDIVGASRSVRRAVPRS
jgi:hypothetical protein